MGVLKLHFIYEIALNPSLPLLGTPRRSRRRFSTSVAMHRPSRRASRLEASPLSSTSVANSSRSSLSPSSRQAEASRVTLARRSPRRRSCRPSSITVLRFAAPGAAQHRPPPPPPVPELGRAPSPAESACATAAAITAPPEVCPAVDLLLAVSVFFKRPLKSTACDPVKLMLPLVSRVRRVSTRVPSHAAALAAVARHGLPLRGPGPSLHAR